MNMNEAQPRLPFKYLSVEQMNSLPTSRLLAYYKKHRECLLQMSRNARYCTDDGKFVNLEKHRESSH